MLRYDGSFPPMVTDSDSDSDSDSKPYCYIVLCTTFSTGTDSDLDPCMDSFRMVTVPILGMDLRPRDPNPNPSPLVEMSHDGTTKPKFQGNSKNSQIDFRMYLPNKD